MSSKRFIQKENLKIIWEVIVDEELFTFLSNENQKRVYQIFLNNIQGFYEKGRGDSTSLVEMNKKYILFILNYIKNELGQQKPDKIRIQEEIEDISNLGVKELITHEDIQNDRKTKFEVDLNRRQEEFDDSMTLKTPAPLDFKDKQNDNGPIKEMDKILKEMQAQRNYEVEHINRSYNNTTQVDNWLKPQETSMKSEKGDVKTNTGVDDPSLGKRFRFLNSTLEQQQEKTVTWNNQDTIIELNTDTNTKNNVINNAINNATEYMSDDDDTIFTRLKKISDNENPRVIQLEKDIKNINNKLDKLFELINPLLKLERT
jgi:hypothetical protein